MTLIRGARVLLIRLGKILPFIICLLAAISYLENIFAVVTENYVYFQGCAVPNKPISFAIGQYFEYGVQFVIVMAIISVAIETCIYNKLGVAYLTANLVEKHVFDNIVVLPTTCVIISALNAIIALAIAFKGLYILSRNKNTL